MREGACSLGGAPHAGICGNRGFQTPACGIFEVPIVSRHAEVADFAEGRFLNEGVDDVRQDEVRVGLFGQPPCNRAPAWMDQGRDRPRAVDRTVRTPTGRPGRSRRLISTMAHAISMGRPHRIEKACKGRRGPVQARRKGPEE